MRRLGKLLMVYQSMANANAYTYPAIAVPFHDLGRNLFSSSKGKRFISEARLLDRYLHQYASQVKEPLA